MKLKRTIQLLRSRWLTSLDCALNGGVLSLSQRCGDLRMQGVEVASKWVITSGGARVKAWRIVRATRWTA